MELARALSRRDFCRAILCCLRISAATAWMISVLPRLATSKPSRSADCLKGSAGKRDRMKRAVSTVAVEAVLTSFSFSCRLTGASLSPDTLAGAVVVGVVGVGVRLSSAAEGTMGRKEDLTAKEQLDLFRVIEASICILHCI